MMIERYQRRTEKYRLLCNRISRVTSSVVFLKFVLIVVAVVQAIIMYKWEHYLIGGVALLFFLAGYVYLDKKHYALTDSRDTAERLATINSDAVKRFNGQWREFTDNGDDLNPPDHHYSDDLDILGQDSLFQWMNMGATPWGRQALANILLFPSGDISEITARQQAVAELAPRLSFRHRLKAEGIKTDINKEEFRRLFIWAQTKRPLFRKPMLIVLIRILSFITLTVFALGVAKIIPLFLPLAMLIVQGGMLFACRKNLKTIRSVYACQRSLVKLEAVFVLIEKRKFNASFLQALKKKMLNEQNNLPSKQIKNLSKLASSVSNRNHMLYFIINLFLLWDFNCYFALEKWKGESGRHLKKWFEVLGEVEALASLALLKYDHPGWTVPSFEKAASSVIIDAHQVGHPLITRGCVLNDIQFTREHPIVLITGSNMSGKSTFLRTIGVNLVLAYTGAPVNARALSCQVMSLATCMRVADNLQKNISSFYAEILRVKMIIDQVKRERVFFLLDELFKGTNSIDRHTAAKTIIQYLNQTEAAGMVSTHDLDLEVLENESEGKVLNYHFKENYKGDKISFDYKLRRGVSDTRNAIFLIKASGIDVF